jgi:hypothetical protein
MIRSTIDRIVYIDVLDLWSVPAILKHVWAKQKIYYLACSQRILSRIVIKILKIRGYQFDRLISYFEASPYERYYTDFHKEVLNLMHGVIYKICEEKVDEIGKIGKIHPLQRDRIIRSLVLNSWHILHRPMELLFTLKHTKTSGNDMVLLQNNEHFSVLAGFFEDLHLAIVGYSAPLRYRVPVRKGFCVDSTDVSPSFIRGLIYLVFGLWNVVLSVALWLHGYCKAYRYSPDHKRFRFDIIALCPSWPQTYDGFNHLYWVDDLRRSLKLAVLCLGIGSHKSKAMTFYGKKVDGLCSIGFPVLRGPDASMIWALVGKEYIKRVLPNVCTIGMSMLRGAVDFVSSAYLLRLLSLVSFYEALLVTSRAKVSWSMMESEDMNTQALATAMKKVDGLALGSTWSMWSEEHIDASFNRGDIFFVWGKRQVNIFKSSRGLVSRYVKTGYPTIRHYKKELLRGSHRGRSPKSSSDNQQRRIVAFYDNACFTDTIIDCLELRNVYLELLRWLDERPEVLLLLKPKRDQFKKLGRVVTEKIETFKQTGAIVIRSDQGDLEPGLIADVVVGISASTPACVAAAFGRPCVLYDRHGVMDQYYWPLDLDHIFRVKEADALGQAIDSGLAASVRDNSHGGNVDCFVDLKGDERTAFYIRCLLGAFSEGKASSGAIQYADCEYGRKWGADKIESGWAQ